MNGQPETLDDAREYIKQLKRDLAAASKRLEEMTNIVARFAAWSKKWPKDVIHPASKEREMHEELDAIEAAALAAIDGKESES